MKCICLALLAPAVSLAWLICLDPGHGGADPGAVGIYYFESYANLDVSFRTRSYMEQVSAIDHVGMTRTTDVDVSLAGRVAFANAGGYDRFISIHHNAFNTNVQGTETFCHPSGSSASFDMRDRVHPRLVAAYGYNDRGVKTANFYVLRNTTMPAILTEASFIDYDGSFNESYRFFTHWQDHDGIQGHAQAHGLSQHLGAEIINYLSRVVDNSYPRFSVSDPAEWGSGAWGIPFGPDYRFSDTGDTPADWARWSPYLPAAGWFTVYAWWVSGTNRATDARFTVNHMGGTTEIFVDQTVGGNQWNSLGAYQFSDGFGWWVQLSDDGCSPGKVVIADAVRFLPATGAGDTGSTGAAVLRPRLTVYPNPARSFLITLYGCEHGASVRIFDISGRIVKTLHPETTSERQALFVWNPLHEPAGIYFVKARTSSGILTEKVVVSGYVN